MVQRHPHTDATYRVVPLDKASFGVEVSIPETCPTTVSNFATEAAAEAWIERHKYAVANTTTLTHRPRPRAPAPATAQVAAPAEEQRG